MILYFVNSVSSQKQEIHQDVLGQCDAFPHLWKLEPSDLELSRTWSKSISYIPWHICIFSCLADAQNGSRVGVSLTSPWLYPLKWHKNISSLFFILSVLGDHCSRPAFISKLESNMIHPSISRTWCAHLPPANCWFECDLSIL